MQVLHCVIFHIPVSNILFTGYRGEKNVCENFRVENFGVKNVSVKISEWNVLE